MSATSTRARTVDETKPVIARLEAFGSAACDQFIAPFNRDHEPFDRCRFCGQTSIRHDAKLAAALLQVLDPKLGQP